MSEVKDTKSIEVPVNLKLTDEEIKVIEGLITTTQYPHDFIEGLNKEPLDTERKLVLMYHFSQGHMYSAMHGFMINTLPKMMGMGAADEKLVE